MREKLAALFENLPPTDILESLSNITPVGITFVNTAGKITYANSNAEKILKLSKTQIATRTYDDPKWQITDLNGNPFPPEKLPFVIVKNTLRPVSNIQHAIRWKNGRVTPLNINATPLLSKSKTFLGMVATIEDISEKLNAKKAVREQRERADAYLEVAGVMFITLDQAGNITLANPKACEILGYTKEEIIGKNWFENFLPKDIIAATKNVHKRIIAGKITPLEFYINPVIRKDGELRIIAWHNNIIRDTQGKITGTISSGEDITDREKATQEIQKIHQLYQKTIENANGIPYRLNYQTMDYDYFGFKSAEILGIRSDDMTFQKLRALVKDYREIGSLDSTDDIFVEKQFLAGKLDRFVAELRIVTPGGKERWLTDTALPITDEKTGKIIGSQGILMDITARKVANLEIEKSHKATLNILEDLMAEMLEKEAAQNALQESNQRLDLALQGAELGLWDQNFKTETVYRNDQWAKMLGYNPGEVKDNPDAWKERIHPADRANSEAAVREHEEGRSGHFKIEHRLRCKNGTYKWILNWGKISERDQDGKPLRAIGIHLDIDDRRRAQEKIMESEERLRLVMEATNDGVFDWNILEDSVYYNTTFYTMLGYQPGELPATRQTYFDLLHPEDRQKSAMIMSDTNSGIDQPCSSELRFKTKNNKWKWILARSKVVRYDQKGKATRIVGTNVDISRRKRIEEELRESRRRFQTLFDQAAEMIFLHDMNGNIIDANEQTLRQYGYTKEELLKMNIRDIDPEINSRDDPNKFWKLSDRHPKAVFQSHHKRKNGGIFPVAVTLSNIRLGENSYVLGLARDVSEYTRLITQLEKSEKRIRSLAVHLQNIREDERKVVAREIHDEIAQTMTAIKIDLSILSANLAANYPEVSAHYAGDIQSMKDLIDTTINRIRELIQRLRPTTLDSLGLIEAMRWLMTDLTKNIPLRGHYRSYVKKLDLGDDQMLAFYRIYQEAITNAIRHAEAKNIYASVNTKDNQLILTIRDDGIGLPQAKLDQYDSFGLTGMRERALSLSGSLEIDGKSGKGTKIILTVPLPAD